MHRGEDLAALQPQWWELWRRAAAPPFVSPAWLIPWWQIFRPGELRSIAVLDGVRLIALAALYRDRGRLLPVGIDCRGRLPMPDTSRLDDVLSEGELAERHSPRFHGCCRRAATW